VCRFGSKNDLNHTYKIERKKRADITVTFTNSNIIGPVSSGTPDFDSQNVN
jgi:hypothetical protein